MMEYRYFMYGMFDGTDGNRYDICIPSPFVRNSKVEAIKDEMEFVKGLFCKTQCF